MCGISYTVGIFVEIYALERDAQLLTRLLLSKATPCGADGREQVDLTAFFEAAGPGERALSTVARRGFAPITFLN